MSKELFISSSPHETKVAVLEDDALVEVYHERDTGIGLVGGIYKGRVSRVLPGMQSAFVNIGLERDAFLYVSDFFEDSEEYDKVVSEAEARVSRLSAEPATGAGPTVAEAPVVVSPPPAASDVAPATEPSGAESGPEVTSAQVASPPTEAPSVATLPEAPETVVAEPVAPSVPPPAAATAHPPARPAGEPQESGGQRGQDYSGGRRRRRRGRGFRERKFGSRPGSYERPQHSSAPERPPHSEDYSNPHDFQVLPGESLAKYANTPPEAAASPAESAERVTENAPPAYSEATPAETSPAGIAVGSEGRDLSTERPTVAQASTTPSAVAQPLVAETAAEAFRVSPPLAAEPEERAGTLELPQAEAVIESPETSGFRERAEASLPSPQTESSAESTSDTLAEGDGRDEAPPPAPSAEAVEASAEPVTELPSDRTPLQPVAPVPGTQPESASQPAERSYTLREPHHRPHFAPRRGRRGRRGVGDHSPRPRSGPAYASDSRPGNNQPVQISELLKEGQEILVQIAKEPLGNKGARITSHIALPGRYLVYMPTIHHIGVSRKIGSEEERLRLRNIILENRGSLTGGFIVRTAGAGRSEDEFKADLKFLSALWADIRGKVERTKAPALLHRDLDLVQRILRDMLSPDFKTVRVDNEVEYERVLDFVSRCQPSLVGHVKLWNRDTPLFEEFGIQAEIDKALKPKVWLKSGGFIVINQTEALVAIDVNTGKYVGKTNRLEDTIVKTNIDAVKEIVRQIRLRDLGGIIVIDFIDMDERRNRQKVVQALEEALRADRAPTNILSINEFGLVALTRKRVKQSLERTLSEPCHYCGGAGWIKSPSTVCLEILAEARKMASQFEGKTVTLRVSPEVAHSLKSRDGVLLLEIESILHKDVIVKSDPTVHQERFEIF
ncbi:MAG TPA: Rne/Rng family ribonuclease [Terriglobia bacterium]|nr:Rne/Rng family ribonuclease [Terriglobia bacterium]